MDERYLEADPDTGKPRYNLYNLKLGAVAYIDNVYFITAGAFAVTASIGSRDGARSDQLADLYAISETAWTFFMLAEVISIGDELTSGQRLDTNSQWLSTRLGELGVEVRFHTTVADELAANVAVFRAAIERADIVVASGGLGPTADDLTREALAEATGRPLVLDAAALDHIVALFARRRRPMPEANHIAGDVSRRQPADPQSGRHAPGIDLEVPRAGREPCRVFALPGVPAEMFRMWARAWPPRLPRCSDRRRVIRHRRIKCFGVGESDLEADAARSDSPRPRAASGHHGERRDDHAADHRRRSTADDCVAAMEPTVATIRECLGKLVFGEEDDELQDAVVRLLADRKATLATAEWGTGGLIANWLSEAADRLPTAASCYAGGFVVGSVAARTLLQGSTESSATAAEVGQLAVVCRERLGVNFALATGPTPPQSGADRRPIFVMRNRKWRANPIIAVYRTARHFEDPRSKQVLNLLRLELLRTR